MPTSTSFLRHVVSVSVYVAIAALSSSCADLIVRNVHNENLTTPGNLLVMKAEVANQGSKQAPASTTTLETKYQPSDPFVQRATKPTPSLAPGAHTEIDMWHFALPDPQQQCLFARVCADAGHAVNEGLHEGNNCRTTGFLLNPRGCRSCDLCCVETPPAAFDWTSWNGRDWVTGVRDQGGCGSCWAFAAVGAIEARKNVEDVTNSPIDLSEQNLVTCNGGGGSCLGGWPEASFQYVTANGIVTETDFPYQSSNCVTSQNGQLVCTTACTGPSGQCANPLACSWATPATTWQIGAWSEVDVAGSADKITDIKRALLCHGPLSVCGPWPSGGGHCVVLVGWNDNPLGSGGAGWKIKNSWGTGWGTGGYGTIPYSGSSFSDLVNYASYVELVTRR